MGCDKESDFLSVFGVVEFFPWTSIFKKSMVSTEFGFRFQKSIQLICGIFILCFEELIKDPWKDFEIRRETICASKGLAWQDGE